MNIYYYYFFFFTSYYIDISYLYTYLTQLYLLLIIDIIIIENVIKYFVFSDFQTFSSKKSPDYFFVQHFSKRTFCSRIYRSITI